MAWIESHQELGRHPKTRKLARVLGCELPCAVGYLHFLWWWAMDYAQDGDLARYDAEEIAEGAQFRGDPKTLVDGLVAAGFLDRADDHHLLLHDWAQYGGKMLLRSEADVERSRLTVLIRRRVIERDGYRCGMCGGSVDSEDVHIDHIVPVSRGGKSTLDNLRVTHSTCNLAKGARMPVAHALGESEGD